MAQGIKIRRFGDDLAVCNRVIAIQYMILIVAGQKNHRHIRVYFPDFPGQRHLYQIMVHGENCATDSANSGRAASAAPPAIEAHICFSSVPSAPSVVQGFDFVDPLSLQVDRNM